MIRKKPYKQNNNNRIFIQANYRIRVPEVRVLSETGEMIGVMPTQEAIAKATEQEKDLVLVTEKANPPIAKIIELSKFKYQQQQKAAKQRKSNKTLDIKELRYTIFIGEADFQSRLKRIFEFLTKGHKVRLTLNFKGRQITKKELAYELFAKIFAATAEVAQVEIEPKILGKKMIAQITPLTKKKNEKTQNQN